MTSKYHAEFVWLDGTIKTFNRFKSLSFNTGVNAAGGFEAVLSADDDALDILMGSNLLIYKEDYRVFGGRTQLRKIDEANDIISITGVDFTGLLGTRKITYDTRGAMESSAVIKILLQNFIRSPSETLPLFDIDYDKYILGTATNRRWQFTKASVLDASIRIANASTSNAGRTGFMFYLDPHYNVHFEPLGANQMRDTLLHSKIIFEEDHRDIRNLIEYYGGKESTYPIIPDSWTDYGSGKDWIARTCRECQTTCQNLCEAGCEVCGQSGHCETTCEVACKAPGCGMTCQETCLIHCQMACQDVCQLCSESPPGGLVGV